MALTPDELRARAEAKRLEAAARGGPPQDADALNNSADADEVAAEMLDALAGVRAAVKDFVLVVKLLERPRGHGRRP